jgi:hypothetical protein
METNDLLQALISEVRGLRQDIKSTGIDTCSTREALIMLGVNNSRILKHFFDNGLLDRRGGGSGGYVYYKSELLVLAGKIKSKTVQMPKLS